MLKLPEGVTRPRCPVRSREYVNKVMGLSAVARPCGDLDGRVGSYEAARDSKYHKCGDVYEVDCEMDAGLFYKMVTEDRCPVFCPTSVRK
jgi:hypothetical protein